MTGSPDLDGNAACRTDVERIIRPSVFATCDVVHNDAALFAMGSVFPTVRNMLPARRHRCHSFEDHRADCRNGAEFARFNLPKVRKLRCSCFGRRTANLDGLSKLARRTNLQVTPHFRQVVAIRSKSGNHFRKVTSMAQMRNFTGDENELNDAS